MVLYDFSSDINNFWIWLIEIKDLFLKIIVKVYSSLIYGPYKSNLNNELDIKSPNPNINSNYIKEKPKGKSLLLEPVNKYSLRNDKVYGYKNSVPESNTDTPLYKDWRVWAAGTLLVAVVIILYYFYSDGFFPGSDSTQNNHAINSPFGPSIGPVDTHSPTPGPEPTIAPQSPVTDPNTTPRASTTNLPSSNNTFNIPENEWNSGNNMFNQVNTLNQPARRNDLSRMEREYNKYFKEP